VNLVAHLIRMRADILILITLLITGMLTYLSETNSFVIADSRRSGERWPPVRLHQTMRALELLSSGKHSGFVEAFNSMK